MGSTELDFQVRGFTGLNIRDESSVIEDTELSQADNVNIEPGGHLSKRFGMGLVFLPDTTKPVKLLGHFYTITLSRIVASNDSKVYYSDDGTTWTEVLLGGLSISDVEYGVQYLNKFYLIRSNSTIVEWDGTTTTALTGSPSGDFAIVHKERLFVFNSQASGTTNSRLYFSAIGDFSSWPSTNFIDIRPGDGEPLVAGAILQDVLLIFKLNTTWGVYVQGDPINWERRLISSSIGCTSKYSVREIDGFIYFVSTRGVYRTDGVQFLDISIKIEPVFKTRVVIPSTIQLDSAAWWEDKYIVAVATATPQVTWAEFADDGSVLAPFSWSQKYGVIWGASDIDYSYYAYHLKVGGWTKWIFAAFLTPSTFTEIRVDEPIRGLYGGDFSPSGSVHRTLTIYADEDDEIVITVATRTFDLRQALDIKRGKWCGLEIEGQDVSCQITYEVDDALGTPVTFNTTKSKGVYKVVGPGFFRTLRYIFYSRDPSYLAFYSFNTKMHLKRPMIPAGQ